MRFKIIIFIFSLVCHSLAKEVILNLNIKQPIFVTSEKFLSFTLDPSWIFSDDLKNIFLSTNLERNINIAKAFSPAYVRFAGPQSNSFTFENVKLLQDNQTISNHNLNETILNAINKWAEKSGLNLITCIGQESNEYNEDSSETWNLIALSDQMGYNTSWQLGYECQTRCDLRGEKLGKEVKYLRKMLNEFPRYSTSIIVGPDVIGFKTKKEKKYLQNYFNSAGSALSAVTWHPNFDQISLNNNEVIIRDENILTKKENLEKIIGESISDKPLWIAESKEEKCKNQFIGALVWARRLGNAAKIGAQILMRQPFNSNLFKSTPDFWVSLLHKTLVGPEVFDINMQMENKSDINFFCQCTKPSLKYKKGSLTIFGINLTPKIIMANLNEFKINEIDEYILLPGFDTTNRMFAETVLLNNKLLELKNKNEIPNIKPITRKNENSTVSIILPSGGIGFWVIPNLKLKICGFNEKKKKKVNIFTHLQKEEKENLPTEEFEILKEKIKSVQLEHNKQLDLTNADEKKIIKKFKIEKQIKRSRREAKTVNNSDESTTKSIINSSKKISSPNSTDKKNSNSENSTQQSSSRKQIRSIFTRETKKSDNQYQTKSYPINIPSKLSSNTKKLKKKMNKAKIKLFTIFQEMTNPLKYLRPFIVKRETNKISLEKFKELQENQKIRNAEILRNLYESIDKLKNSNILKNTFGDVKLKQFIEKTKEELDNLKNNLRAKQDEIIKNYKSKSTDFFKKPNTLIKRETIIPEIMLKSENKSEPESVSESTEFPSTDFIKKPIKQIIPQQLKLSGKEDKSDESIEIDDAALFLKNYLQNYPKIPFDANALHESVNIFQSNYDDTTPLYDELSSSVSSEEEEDESWKYKKNKRISRSVKFDELSNKFEKNIVKIILKTLFNNSGEKKYSRKRRDADSYEINFDQTSDNEKSIKKNDDNDDDAENSRDEKRKSKKRKYNFNNDIFLPNYPYQSEFIQPNLPFINRNFWNYPPFPRYDYFIPYENRHQNPFFSDYSIPYENRHQNPFFPHYDYSIPYENRHQNPFFPDYSIPYENRYQNPFLLPTVPYKKFDETPSADEFTNNYNDHFKYENSDPYYHHHQILPLYRRRREVNENTMENDKNVVGANVKNQDQKGNQNQINNQKQVINQNQINNQKQVTNQNRLKNQNQITNQYQAINQDQLINDRYQIIAKNTLNDVKKMDLDFLKNIENCLESSLVNCRDAFTTEKIIDKVENNYSDIENSKSEIPNNLESLMSIEKILNKSAQSTKHQVHSRKMMGENKNN